jgi:transposase InsO family protein
MSGLRDLPKHSCFWTLRPPRSPNLNSYAERFVRSIKESCLERLVLFGEKALKKAVREFMTHYHSERNHQGIGKSADHVGSPRYKSPRPGSMPAAPRRNAQLLCAGCVIYQRIPVSGYYGLE